MSKLFCVPSNRTTVAGRDMSSYYPKIIGLSFLVSGCAQTVVDNTETSIRTNQLAVIADQIAWRPCPKNLPPDCEMAVLEGNPREPGLFTARFRVHKGFTVRPHTHPKDERVTVLSGRMAVAFGTDPRRDNARQFGKGDYYVNAAGAVHTVWAVAASEIQVTGFGPWQADYVE